MSTYFTEFRFAVRQLTKYWFYTLVIISSISIGIAGNTVVHHWLNSLILNPIPAINNSNMLFFFHENKKEKLLESSFLDYEDFRAELNGKNVGELIAYIPTNLNLHTLGESRVEKVTASFVSENFFSGMSLQPQIGRFFDAEDGIESLSGKPVVVISHETWKNRFASSTDIIGQKMNINQSSFQIIGVAQPNFTGVKPTRTTEVWLPLFKQESLLYKDSKWRTLRHQRSLDVFLYLNESADIEQARNVVNIVHSRLKERFPSENDGINTKLYSLKKPPNDDIALGLNILFFFSWLIIIIICINITNLLLTKNIAREKELSVRKAIGANYLTIFRLFIIEALAISIPTAALSYLLYPFFAQLLQQVVPETPLPAISVNLFETNALYAISTSIAISIGIYIYPAIKAAGVNTDIALKESMRGTSSSVRQRWIRNTLVASQVAMVYFSLSVAIVFLSSFEQMKQEDVGFSYSDTALLATSEIAPATENWQIIEATQRTAKDFANMPGVSQVGFADWVPLGKHGGSTERLAIDGYQSKRHEDMRIYRNLVSENYFEMLNIPLISGRYFSIRDNRNSRPVIIINESFANTYFQNRNPIGRIVRGRGEALEVVGVVKNTKYWSPMDEDTPFFYLPYRQFYKRGMETIFHIQGMSAEDAANTYQRHIASKSSLSFMTWAMPMATYVKASLSEYRILTILLLTMGLIALALAIIGIYGVVSHSVSLRTQEIGIRMAIGATPNEAFLLIMMQSLRSILIGLVIGFGLYLLLWQEIESLLFNIKGIDLVTPLGIGCLLLFVSILSCYRPIRSAVGNHPMKSLIS